MSGGSGAEIWVKDSLVYERCKNAHDQYNWYRDALEYPRDSWVIIPSAKMYDDRTIVLPYFSGKLAAEERPNKAVEILLSQISIWRQFPSRNWAESSSYNDRCLASIHLVSDEIRADVQRILSRLYLARSFNHGDLTLENCIWQGDRLVLIDPLYEPGLFQSWEIDLAKIRQSCETSYHQKISASCRLSLPPRAPYLDIFNDGCMDGLISVFVRMLKYKNAEEATEVNKEIKKILARKERNESHIKKS